MKRVVTPVLWIGLGVAIGVGVMLASEPLLGRQSAFPLPADNPSFVLKIVAPASTTMTSVECMSGCTFNETRVLLDGSKRNFQTPRFQFGCKNESCEVSATGVVTR